MRLVRSRNRGQADKDRNWERFICIGWNWRGKSDLAHSWKVLGEFGYPWRLPRAIPWVWALKKKSWFQCKRTQHAPAVNIVHIVRISNYTEIQMEGVLVISASPVKLWWYAIDLGSEGTKSPPPSRQKYILRASPLILGYFKEESLAPYTRDTEAIAHFLDENAIELPPAEVVLHAWLCGEVLLAVRLIQSTRDACFTPTRISHNPTKTTWLSRPW